MVGPGVFVCSCQLSFKHSVVTLLLAVFHVPFSMLLHTVLVPEDWALLTTSSLALWFLLGLTSRGPGRSWGRNDAWSSPGSPQMDSVPTHRAQHPALQEPAPLPHQPLKTWDWEWAPVACKVLHSSCGFSHTSQAPFKISLHFILFKLLNLSVLFTAGTWLIHLDYEILNIVYCKEKMV